MVVKSHPVSRFSTSSIEYNNLVNNFLTGNFVLISSAIGIKCHLSLVSHLNLPSKVNIMYGVLFLWVFFQKDIITLSEIRVTSSPRNTTLVSLSYLCYWSFHLFLFLGNHCCSIGSLCLKSFCPFVRIHNYIVSCLLVVF